MKLRIFHKLFLVMSLSCGLTAAVLLGGVYWSLKRGFLEYVNQVEALKLNEIAPALEMEYRREGDWRQLRGAGWRWPHRLGLLSPPPGSPGARPEGREGGPPPRRPEEPFELFGPGEDPADDPFRPREAFEDPRRPPEQESRSRGPNPIGPPPPRADEDPLQVFGRVVFLDAQGDAVIGRPNPELDVARMREIIIDGELVGRLGLVPLHELSRNRELKFLQEQTQAYLIFSFLLLLLAALLSALMAGQVSKPIKALAKAARAVSTGHYEVRTKIQGRDEVAELSQDFDNLVMTLAENEKSRRQWVADISHELRTPLTVLQGEIEAIQDGLRKPDPETLETLHSEVLCLSRLVNDLYELSLSDLGALRYKKERINLATVLSQALHGFENRLADEGLELQTEIEPKSLTMLGDAERLLQLFSNLLENSVRYTDAGGMVRVLATREAEWIRIDVEDSAPGVEAGVRERIFERLFRVEISRNRKTGGAGLGLSICRNIVEAHGGKIEARESELGGLKMAIRFPGVTETRGLSQDAERP